LFTNLLKHHPSIYLFAACLLTYKALKNFASIYYYERSTGTRLRAVHTHTSAQTAVLTDL